MSMILFAVILNSLVCLLERNFRGVRIVHRRKKKPILVAYADDVTIHVFETARADIKLSVHPTDLQKDNRCSYEHL